MIKYSRKFKFEKIKKFYLRSNDNILFVYIKLEKKKRYVNRKKRGRKFEKRNKT